MARFAYGAMKTFVVINTAFIGDVLLTLPLCVAIRSNNIHARVILITTPTSAAMLANNILGIEVLGFDKQQRQKAAVIRQNLLSSLNLHGHITAIVPHKSLSTAKLVQAIKADVVCTYTDAAAKKHSNISIAYPVHLHEADRNLELYRNVSFDPVFGKEHYVPAHLLSVEKNIDCAQKFSLPASFIVLAPATVWTTKQWPIEYWQMLARMIAKKINVVIIGDSSIQGLFTSGENITDLSAQTTLEEVLSIVALSCLVVANDSAPVHMASLFGKPTVALFGPTIPEYGFSPFSKNSVVVQNEHLKCRPCTKHGGLNCPLGTHECLHTILPHAVERHILGILQYETH